jgi:IS30 family transposase
MCATLTGKQEEALMSYQQITHEERYQIEILLKAGKNYSEIGHLLDRHPSSISREIRRNRGLRGYRVKQAHSMALERRLLKQVPRIADSTWVLAVAPKNWTGG